MPDSCAVVESDPTKNERPRPKRSGNRDLQSNLPKTSDPVATGLRPVVYLYAVLNIMVVALLFSTVSPTLAIGPAQEIASLR